MRFPGFDDEWTETTLGGICQVLGGGTPRTDTAIYWGGDIQWFTPTEVGHKKFVSSSNRTITSNGLKNSGAKLLPKGTVLLTTRATIGECSIATVECCTNQGFQSLVPIEGFSISEYLYQVLLTKKEELLRKANGSTFKEISTQGVKDIPINFPKLPEQTKIADFLSLLDERIACLSETIKNRKTEKATLLRQLFDRSLRFPEFSDEWQQTTLGEVCTIKTGKLDANAMVEDGPYPFFTCAKQTYQTDTYSFSGEAILVAGNGEVGLVKYYDGKFNAYQRTYVLQSSCRDIILLFIRNYIDYALPKRIISFLNGSAMPYITLSTLSDMPIALPSLAEQKRIAELFTTFDERIEVEEALLKCCETQKRYLLRQMFV